MLDLIWMRFCKNDFDDIKVVRSETKGVKEYPFYWYQKGQFEPYYFDQSSRESENSLLYYVI